jgi:hypothetical protein
MRKLIIALAFAASATAGCASVGFPELADPKDVPTTWGAPRITRIRDLGSVRLPEAGAWKGEPDGVASPGELILVEGDNFGRLPTVSIGGRATGIIARTEGGGIIAQVPAGVPVGDVPIVVSHPKGKATRNFPIRRFALVAEGGQLYALAVDKESAKLVGKPLDVEGAKLVRIAGDGATALVVAARSDGDYLVGVDLGAPGGPRLGVTRKLAHRGHLIAAAMDAPITAIVGDGQITLVRTKGPQSPALYEPIDLPMGAKAPRAIELSPDGKLLALLVPEGNRLIALDVGAPPEAKVLTAVDILPEAKLPLVRDLAFASDGETLWIVSGDNEKSVPAIQPTRLTAVRILAKPEDDSQPATPATARAPTTLPANATNPPSPPSGAPAPPSMLPLQKGVRILSLWRTQSVPGAAAPLAIAVAKGQPLASGTTIRMPPDKAAVFVSSVNDALFKLADMNLATAAGAKSAAKLWHPPNPGIMVRADINGGGGPLFATGEIMSSLDLTPDAQLVVAVAARVKPEPGPSGVATTELGVVYAPIFRAQPTATFLPLGNLSPAQVKPPFNFGSLRIQP